MSGRWYGRRYGIVKGTEPPVLSGLTSILHPETRPQRAADHYYSYRSGVFAVLFLVWALSFVPDLFLGHKTQPGGFALLLAAFQVVPRCIYPVTGDWSVLLRRVLASTVLIAMIGIYLEYCFAQINLWTWMTLVLSFLLLLDLYDHWLLNHLLGIDFREASHE